MTPALRWPALLGDVVAVGAFVAIGRAAHSHGLQPSGLASTAWPFVVGLAVGWLVIARVMIVGRRAVGDTVSAGVVAWLCTVSLGMVLRAVAGQGVDATFVAVALAFLGLFLLGWRLVVAGVRRRI